MNRAGNDGFSYGIDHIKEMQEFVFKNINKNHESFLKDGKVIIKLSDAREGLIEFAPYDVIYVGMTVKEIPRNLIA
jgi:protein-L-isoaspartate O-methyltransferase